MKLDKPRTFQYVKINNRYFCLQQNIAVLAWLLTLKRDDLNSVFTPWLKQALQRRLLGYPRYYYRLFIFNCKTLILFVLYQLKLRDIDSIVELPVYGHLCLRVHKGHKIFNLKSGMVVKVFDSDVKKESILDELERLQNVSQINFAPTLRKWNVDEKWYKEDYIHCSSDSSYRVFDSETLWKKYEKDVVPCIYNLIQFRQPKTKGVKEYINEIIEILEVSRLSRQVSTISEFNKIKGFIDSIVECLRVEGNCPVQLVFTHGDFCPANMLNTTDGIKIIDWEGATYRSALFDFYSYFFYLPYSGKLPVDKMFTKIGETMPAFISGLALSAPDISKSILSLENTYRWIYYIEQVCSEVKREMTDKNLNILDCILRYIAAFNRYEEILSDRTIIFNNKRVAKM